MATLERASRQSEFEIGRQTTCATSGKAGFSVRRGWLRDSGGDVRLIRGGSVGEERGLGERVRWILLGGGERVWGGNRKVVVAPVWRKVGFGFGYGSTQRFGHLCYMKTTGKWKWSEEKSEDRYPFVFKSYCIPTCHANNGVLMRLFWISVSALMMT